MVPSVSVFKIYTNLAKVCKRLFLGLALGETQPCMHCFCLADRPIGTIHDHRTMIALRMMMHQLLQ